MTNFVSNHDFAWVLIQAVDVEGDIVYNSLWQAATNGTNTIVGTGRSLAANNASPLSTKNGNWFLLERMRNHIEDSHHYLIKCHNNWNERQSYLRAKDGLTQIFAETGPKSQYDTKIDPHFCWEIIAEGTGDDIDCTIKNVGTGFYIQGNRTSGNGTVYFGNNPQSNHPQKWNISSVDGLFLKTGIANSNLVRTRMPGNDGGVFD